ncbi:hypothetical protein HMPREF3196_00969 [Bifidobacterium bifidum]|uniref:Uncharacterized protein n=1 Tax=Bifidobacterium bifidum TaxID=1681 RepID=A0A133KPT8_BIFBI|nr:hypothetical protein BIFBIF_00936 [Bifidobacterium bifidum ATCC 29521 = JCM 1255 = DSM 20456]KWZ81505.1 hypothetical protein HMPREF3196_00969 [Bifidobacterium bifidum]
MFPPKTPLQHVDIITCQSGDGIARYRPWAMDDRLPVSRGWSG